MPGDLTRAPLMQWSIFQWQVWPVNLGEYDHQTASDWARKEILGAGIYREWVGENDEEVHMRGELFPYYYATMGDPGLETIQLLDNMRKAGHVDMLIRGDGYRFGWFVIDRLTRGHKVLGPDGIGKRISFEAVFIRIPKPDPAMYLSSLWTFLLPQAGQQDHVAPEVPGTER
jgi:phage protein U